jgi:putative tryptophan/tyrosine transport system substrate-binding protein
MADLVSRRVAVIVTASNINATLAAKAATATIPIVFAVIDDPVKHGLVASLARPGGNANGVNFLIQEVVPKRLDLLLKLVPKAVRVAVLFNPKGNALLAETTLRDVEEAARAFGLQIQVLNASTSREIDAVFDALGRERPDALFVAPSLFLSSRRAQIVSLAARDRIPVTADRDTVAAGGLMSYGTDSVEMSRQVGVYTGRILRGEKPSELPVQQATKFELVINAKTAKALGLTIPPDLLAVADEVIE